MDDLLVQLITDWRRRGYLTVSGKKDLLNQRRNGSRPQLGSLQALT